MPEKLAALPKPPEELLYLWNWLSRFESPLHYSELESWARLTGKEFAIWEIDVMTALDRIRST